MAWPKTDYRVKHGHSSVGGRPSATYTTWNMMLQRVLNPNATGYKYYGGRGIKVCKRWLKFDNFLKDMGVRPEGMILDRINNDGDYKPSNCRWATPVSSANNRSERNTAWQ